MRKRAKGAGTNVKGDGSGRSGLDLAKGNDVWIRTSIEECRGTARRQRKTGLGVLAQWAGYRGEGKF